MGAKSGSNSIAQSILAVDPPRCSWEVAKELGILEGAESIRDEVHRMLLYDPGASFEEHRE